ncbi:hypothetical protein Droror1_Dr00025514 [Drosera rotundifolia]
MEYLFSIIVLRIEISCNLDFERMTFSFSLCSVLSHFFEVLVFHLVCFILCFIFFVAYLFKCTSGWLLIGKMKGSVSSRAKNINVNIKLGLSDFVEIALI